jgi:uncharacterized protein (DUF305 family)
MLDSKTHMRLGLSAIIFACGIAVGTAATDSPSVAGFKAAMERMHMAMMSIQYSGNPDVDFARGMIPHHRGAIDMAEVELKFGKAPEMRELATEIVAAQKKEIANMKQWLSGHGG